jgi:hypothetical protein
LNVSGTTTINNNVIINNNGTTAYAYLGVGGLFKSSFISMAEGSDMYIAT